MAAGCATRTGYTSTRFPGNIIPSCNRIDPVAQKFFSLNPFINLPNLPVTYTTTGPENDFYSGNHYLSDRQAFLIKHRSTDHR